MTTQFCEGCGSVRGPGRFCSHCGRQHADSAAVPAPAADAEADWLRLVGEDPSLTSPTTPNADVTPATPAAPQAAFVPEAQSGPGFDRPTPDAPLPLPLPLPRPVDEGRAAADVWAADAPANLAPAAHAPAAPAPADQPSGAPRWLLPAMVVAALGIGGAAYWSFADIRPTAELAEKADEPAVARSASASATAPDSAWQSGYVDAFLSDETVDMMTGGSAQRRDYPAAEGTQILSQLPPSTPVRGRWVRGHDGASRWLRLDDGSYIWEANLTRPHAMPGTGPAGAPIAIPFSNTAANFGAEIEGVMRGMTNAPNEGGAPTLRPMAPRNFNGVTVTGVVGYYEGGGVLFREPMAAVIAAFRAAGVKVAGDGSVPMAEDVVVDCWFETPRSAELRRLGATVLACGV